MTYDFRFKAPTVVRHQRVLSTRGIVWLPVHKKTGTDGARLRKIRRELDLTLGDASRATGIAVHELSSLECGEASIDERAYEDCLRYVRKQIDNP